MVDDLMCSSHREELSNREYRRCSERQPTSSISEANESLIKIYSAGMDPANWALGYLYTLFAAQFAP
jgi:hypothetical protein